MELGLRDFDLSVERDTVDVEETARDPDECVRLKAGRQVPVGGQQRRLHHQVQLRQRKALKRKHRARLRSHR